MLLEDFLAPGEQIKFRSSVRVHYGGRLYQVVMTDRRILLYARRGIMKGDPPFDLDHYEDEILFGEKLEVLQGAKYSEKQSLFSKKGIIHIEGRTQVADLWGSAAEIKALYQQMMQFM